MRHGTLHALRRCRDVVMCLAQNSSEHGATSHAQESLTSEVTASGHPALNAVAALSRVKHCITFYITNATLISTYINFPSWERFARLKSAFVADRPAAALPAGFNHCNTLLFDSVRSLGGISRPLPAAGPTSRVPCP